ncbi:MAG TPA: SRPBCC family protein [Phenylobacterium sp.]|nr:SRPBCC family protein [Phenylobacterium sp.]
MLRLLALTAAALSLASAARALDLPPRAETLLDRGRPYVDVRPDPDGESGLIQAAIDVAAPAETVFRVITDCELAAKMVDSLKSCRVLERDPAGRWDVREEVSKMTFVPSVTNVFRSDYDPPAEVRFHRVGGDLRVFEGAWRIEPHGHGVRVFYENRVSAPFRVPGYLARFALRMEVPRALVALRREAQARAPPVRTP